MSKSFNLAFYGSGSYFFVFLLSLIVVKWRYLMIACIFNNFPWGFQTQLGLLLYTTKDITLRSNPPNAIFYVFHVNSPVKITYNLPGWHCRYRRLWSGMRQLGQVLKVDHNSFSQVKSKSWSTISKKLILWLVQISETVQDKHWIRIDYHYDVISIIMSVSG